MKLSVLVVTVLACALSSGAFGWWLRDWQCTDGPTLAGDFYGSSTRYTERAFWQTNLELEQQLADSPDASRLGASPRCLVLSKGPGSFEIIFHPGSSRNEFPQPLRESLSTFAINRLREHSSEDSPASPAR